MTSTQPEPTDGQAVRDRPTGKPTGPWANITVQHLLGEEEPFHFEIHDEQASCVRVGGNGDIWITWCEGDGDARLQFLLTYPETAFLDGVLIGWRGDDLPVCSPRNLSYRVEAKRMVDGEAVRVVAAELGPSSETYSYRLAVAYPDGTTDSIDPRIYNQGDGGPPPGRP